VKPIDLANASAPARDPLSVCPHCWEVNIRAHRLCGRCGADMHTVLQESGGLRWTAAVQSPVPVRGGAALSVMQRVLILCFLLLLIVGQIIGALFASASAAVRAEAAADSPTHTPVRVPAPATAGMD
jgi:hypothetical protein